MKTVKIPRKLKKEAKIELLTCFAPVWKTKELKIYGFDKNYKGKGYYKITSHTLGF